MSHPSKNLIFIVLALLLINACKPSNYVQYNFDPRKLKENKITLSEIADDVIYLPLDNTFPVGNIGFFNFTKQSIYFFSNEGIITFDRVKNYLQRIGNKGRGPGEYLFYHRFSVDEKTEKVYVLDQGDIVKTYSKSGQFLGSFPLKRFGNAASIDFFESGLLVSYDIQYENARYNWIFFDTTGKIIIKRESGIPTFNSTYSNNYSTYKLGNRIFYWNAYTDTVFSVLPDLTEEPSFIVCPGEHRFPRSRDVPINPYEKYMVLNSIFETNRYVVIQYYYKNSNLLLYDKQFKKSFLIKLEYEQNICINGIINDFDGGPMFLPVQYISENGREYMVGLINPFKIKKQVASDEFKNSAPKYPEKKADLKNLSNTLKETDNPVIIMVRLKK